MLTYRPRIPWLPRPSHVDGEEHEPFRNAAGERCRGGRGRRHCRYEIPGLIVEMEKRRIKSWRKMLRTREHLAERGYELEVDEFVRREIGETRERTSCNPWTAYIRQERAREALRKDRASTAAASAKSRSLDGGDAFAAQAAATSIAWGKPGSDPTHLPSLSPREAVPRNGRYWLSVASRSVHPKGSALLRKETSYPMRDWAHNLLESIEANYGKESEDSPRIQPRQTPRRQLGLPCVRQPPNTAPSAMVRGRILLVDAPADPKFRRRMRMEKDVLASLRDPANILPLPTFARSKFTRIVDDFGELLREREELRLMEAEERWMHGFLRRERRQRAIDMAQQNNQRALNFFRRLQLRGVYQRLMRWHEHTQKMKRLRGFVRERLMSGQRRCFVVLRDYALVRIQVKIRGFMLLQAHGRRCVCRRRYLRKCLELKASAAIARAWRAFCARNLLARMRKAHEEQERRIALQLRRILHRATVNVLVSWRQHTKIMNIARAMGFSAGRRGLREKLLQWRRNVERQLNRKPLAARSLQSFWRRWLSIQRMSLLMSMHRAAKSIQGMVRAHAARNVLATMRRHHERIMRLVAGRLRARTHRVQRVCIHLMREHAVQAIQRRTKLAGFVAVKTRRLLQSWKEVTARIIESRIRAVVNIQRTYRGFVARQEAEVLRIERLARLDEERKRQKISSLSAVRDGPELDASGLPRLNRTTPRLDLLRAELEQLEQLPPDVAHFDSQVLSFSQRFPLRTKRKYLHSFLLGEIRTETFRIWNQDRDAELAAAARARAALEADTKRAAEMRALLAEKRAEGMELDDEVVYPTAGSQLHFANASKEEMIVAIKEWMGLLKLGYLSRGVLIQWTARGILNQDSAIARIAAWEAVKETLSKDLLWEVNASLEDFKTSAT